MDMIEEWKDIVGYEGFYMVSNYGNVKSLSRKSYCGNGYRIKKERLLKKCLDSYKYEIVGLHINKKTTTKKVHQLVYIAFNEVCFITNINHINGIKTDNRIENLENITSRENACHRSTLKSSTSKYTGVCWHKAKRKWISQIYHNKKMLHLGTFDIEEEAFKARVDYENKLNIENKYTFIENK